MFGRVKQAQKICAQIKHFLFQDLFVWDKLNSCNLLESLFFGEPSIPYTSQDLSLKLFNTLRLHDDMYINMTLYQARFLKEDERTQLHIHLRDIFIMNL